MHQDTGNDLLSQTNLRTPAGLVVVNDMISRGLTKDDAITIVNRVSHPNDVQGRVILSKVFATGALKTFPELLSQVIDVTAVNRREGSFFIQSLNNQGLLTPSHKAGILRRVDPNSEYGSSLIQAITDTATHETYRDADLKDSYQTVVDKIDPTNSSGLTTYFDLKDKEVFKFFELDTTRLAIDHGIIHYRVGNKVIYTQIDDDGKLTINFDGHTFLGENATAEIRQLAQEGAFEGVDAPKSGSKGTGNVPNGKGEYTLGERSYFSLTNALWNIDRFLPEILRDRASRQATASTIDR